jgi:hypothetical protein
MRSMLITSGKEYIIPLIVVLSLAVLAKILVGELCFF